MRIRKTLVLASPLLGLVVVGWMAKAAGVSFRDAATLIPLPYHLLALGSFLLSLACRGLRLAILARGLGSRLTLVTAAGVQLAGEAAAAATPSRAGSDPARILFLRRFGIQVPTGIFILAGEIMTEGAVLLALTLFLFFFLPSSNAAVLGALPYAATSLGLPLAGLLLVRHPGSRTPPRPWVAFGLSPNRWREFRVGARRLRSEARALTRLDKGTVMAVLLVSLIHLLARLSILPLLVLGVTRDVAVSPLVAWPMVFLYTGSLLPPPGGGGAVEVGFVAALSGVLVMGVLPGILLWWRFYTFYLGAMAGGLLVLAVLGRAGLSEWGRGGKGARAAQGEHPIPEGR
jgi:uncharacterized membrane protein YbhN (UPF0104 family)